MWIQQNFILKGNRSKPACACALPPTEPCCLSPVATHATLPTSTTRSPLEPSLYCILQSASALKCFATNHRPLLSQSLYLNIPPFPTILTNHRQSPGASEVLPANEYSAKRWLAVAVTPGLRLLGAELRDLWLAGEPPTSLCVAAGLGQVVALQDPKKSFLCKARSLSNFRAVGPSRKVAEGTTCACVASGRGRMRTAEFWGRVRRARTGACALLPAPLC